MLKRAFIIAIVGIAALLAAVTVDAIVAPATLPSSGKNRGVDFRDTVRVRDDAVPNPDVRPTLRVAAVAKVLSPDAHRWLDDLWRAVADSVNRRAVFLQRRTYAQVNSLLRRREVDLAMVCSGAYVTGKDKFGMELLAVPVTQGRSTHCAYLIVARDSASASLDDLAGKRFALTDPQSHTGCLAWQYVLAREGKDPSTFFADTFFTYGDEYSIRAVATGVADAASVDSLVWEFLNDSDPVYAAQTRIIGRSEPSGSPAIVVHPELDPDLKEALRRTLLTFHEDPDHRRILRSLWIDAFEEGDDAAYEFVRDARRWLAERGTVK